MAVKIDLGKKRIALGVRDLLAEPLTNNGRAAGLSVWTRMALGREAHVSHQRAQADLHQGYAREMFVRYTTNVDDFVVTIQGRIDGVHPPINGGSYVIEEIKSVVVPPLVLAALDMSSYPHYVEQLRLYCFFIEREQKRVLGRLVFVNAADGTTKEIEVCGPFEDCERLITERVRALIAQAQEEQRRQDERQTESGKLRFPHSQPRLYQDEMIQAVGHALKEGRHLLVSAPAGVGKTAAAIYPVLKYVLGQGRRAFFVTAKNTQQQIVRETLQAMAARGAAHPNAVFFRAREKMCINDVYACREEFCRHLRDFRAKLETTGVVDRLLAQRLITPESMMEAGRGTSLCPFELALIEAEQTDLVVCDYNYVFDPQVYFRRFFQDADYSNAVLIVDETHNLVQRAMEYYSPSLSRRQIRDLSKDLRHVESSLARELRKFLDRIEDFFRSQSRRQGDEYTQLDEGEVSRDKYLILSPREYFEELKPEFNRLTMRYLLDKLTSGRAIPDDPVDEFFSDLGQFCVVLALEGEEFSYVFDTTNGDSLKIVCKDPSRQLAQRLDGFRSVIAMSATLEPMEFYRQMLGFDPKRTDQRSYPSPFPKENRRIIVVPSVSTTYRLRTAHYEKIAQIIATTAAARTGNYMALFPSYEFMQSVAAKLPDGLWELLVQQPKMTEEQRVKLLEALKEPQPPKLVFAVQGGLFAEGIDYPGETLCGVVVVSPALPQVSFERELMRQYYDQRYGKGFEFAYLYPGMNRVIQSVGRLIRSESDQGVAVLVCQRFAQTQYSSLFPPDWAESLKRAPSIFNLATELSDFWNRVGQNPRVRRAF
ncbi:MAG TPA: ATP-dependent DNA helicase [Verrucomicrobiae bacterium]|nr:ATP-dependent DNA helicase [Verrucomicrobiae bacterium]